MQQNGHILKTVGIIVLITVQCPRWCSWKTRLQNKIKLFRYYGPLSSFITALNYCRDIHPCKTHGGAKLAEKLRWLQARPMSGPADKFAHRECSLLPSIKGREIRTKGLGRRGKQIRGGTTETKVLPPYGTRGKPAVHDLGQQPGWSPLERTSCTQSR